MNKNTANKKSPRERIAVKDRTQKNLYFAKSKKDSIEFFSSGVTPLDLALGGGWATRRIINVCGHWSSGKTLLAMEAMANFKQVFKKESPVIHYKECESAFDAEYAAALGIPVSEIIIDNSLETVEELYCFLQSLIEKGKGAPTFVIVDSLDGLGDAAEQSQAVDKGSYGASKAKFLSRLFREMHKPLSEANVTLLIISQLRDNINAGLFGSKYKRSGGTALDFYASQVVWLKKTGKLTKTVAKREHKVGVKVEASITKNKVGLPFKSASYQILFGYGCDDYTACAAWLVDNGFRDFVESVGIAPNRLAVSCNKLLNASDVSTLHVLQDEVTARWEDIQRELLPKASKYNF